MFAPPRDFGYFVGPFAPTEGRDGGRLSVEALTGLCLLIRRTRPRGIRSVCDVALHFPKSGTFMIALGLVLIIIGLQFDIPIFVNIGIVVLIIRWIYMATEMAGMLV